MTTATLARSPTQAPCESPKARLAACAGLIRDAAGHCASRHRREREPDMFEDMAQEATIAVWSALKEYPDAPAGYIWQVAYRAALHVLRDGHSVDSPRVDRQVNYQVFSLEALAGPDRSGLEGKDGFAAFEEALARRKRRGEVPNPTEEMAIARIMYQELWERLTPRQRQVLELRLQQYSQAEAGAALGISQAQVHRLVVAIRAKAEAAWGDKPPPPPRVKLTPKEARERRRERDRLKMRRRYAQHREEYNARSRDWHNATRAQWRDQGRCSRCGGTPSPGHKMCPKCQLRGRVDRRNGRKKEEVLVRQVPPQCQALGSEPR